MPLPRLEVLKTKEGTKDMKAWHLLVGLVAVAALVGMMYIGGFDKRVKSFENGVAQISEVQNQMKRQADTVPNLVETVKGFAKQESSVLLGVTEARAKVGQINIDASKLATDPAALKQLMDNQQGLAGALSKLMVVAERYPDIKSGANFLALQSQIEGTQNRITVARGRYIQVARDHNASLKTFWASMFYSGKFQPLAEFKATEQEMQTPQVKF